MAATTLRLLLLLMTVVQASMLSCSRYNLRNHTTADPAILYPSATNFIDCFNGCTRMGNCTAFLWNTTTTFRCYHVYVLNFRASFFPNSTIAVRNCSTAGFTTARPTKPPFFRTTTFFRPFFSTTTRPTAFPPFFTTTPTPTTTINSCPPAEGLTTGLVVLIACFSAIGGLMIGMILTIKCCPAGRDWFGGSSASGCKACAPSHTVPSVQGCKSCSPSCSPSVQGCHVCHSPPPTQALPPMVGPLPSYTSWYPHGGAIQNTYTSNYNVNGGFN